MSNDLVQQVHDDWKEKGFPYYPKDADWRNNIFNQLSYTFPSITIRCIMKNFKVS